MAEKDDIAKYKELEGSVPVNGDITPVSRKPIDKIDATLWEEMSFESLVDQQISLQKRIDMARTMGRPDMAKQMERGLSYLMQLIETKREREDRVTLL